MYEIGRVKDIRKVTDIKAVGSTILVEMLSPEEAAGSHLVNTGKSTQARIVDIGPALNVVEGKYGFKVGSRVLLQGTFVPVPKFPNGDQRELGIVDAHMIKCVFEEEGYVDNIFVEKKKSKKAG
jgi:hypothetical protein